MIDFNSKEELVNKLSELKSKNLPHMTIKQFSEIEPSFANDIKSASKEELETIKEQLAPFYRGEDNNCVFSDSPPRLDWGLAHGMATDYHSGLSWKCYHYFIINGVSNKYERTLQYHPDNYEI